MATGGFYTIMKLGKPYITLQLKILSEQLTLINVSTNYFLFTIINYTTCNVKLIIVDGGGVEQKMQGYWSKKVVYVYYILNRHIYLVSVALS